MKAMIFDIERNSYVDGPGIRTTVFFKGCNLKCKWCHNPESQSMQKEILFYKNKCTQCGRCKNLTTDDENFLCFADAKEICGREYTVGEVLREIIKDKSFYETSGGGVTFSGGECLLHSQFVKEIATMCKDKNIHTAIESAFFVPWENIQNVLPFIDLFFADLKIPDSEKHRKFTGQDNSLIIENITKLSKEHSNIILRIPVIPGVNDSDDDINAFAEIIKTFGKGIKEIELLKYNHLAESKYDIAGKEYTKFAEKTQTNDEMQKLCSSFKEKCGMNCYFA